MFSMFSDTPSFSARGTIFATASFARFTDHWNPRVAAELNGQQVKLAKFAGAFDWHHHDLEDELFLVIKGQLTIKLRDQSDIVLNEGESVVIPRGLEHLPVADEEAHVLLFEPNTTLNTGNLDNERTVRALERL